MNERHQGQRTEIEIENKIPEILDRLNAGESLEEACGKAKPMMPIMPVKPRTSQARPMVYVGGFTNKESEILAFLTLTVCLMTEMPRLQWYFAARRHSNTSRKNRQKFKMASGMFCMHDVQ